jgi:excisionase family DNA binding protein
MNQPAKALPVQPRCPSCGAVIARGSADRQAQPAQVKAAIPALTVPEAARRLLVSERHVGELIEEGAIRAFNIAPGSSRNSWRIPIEEAERFERQNTAGQPNQPKGRL